jgi:hypothetical protein
MNATKPLLLAFALGACAGDGPATGGAWADPRAEVSVGAFQRDRTLRERVPACARAPAPVTGDSVGPLRAGQTLAELEARCPGAMRGWDRGDGPPIPTLAVRLGASVTIALMLDTVADARVAQVESAELATAEGMGAGTSLEELLATYGDGLLVERDCAVEIEFAALRGVSFMLAMPPGGGVACDEIPDIVEENAIDLLPPGTLVAWVIHHGGV